MGGDLGGGHVFVSVFMESSFPIIGVGKLLVFIKFSITSELAVRALLV